MRNLIALLIVVCATGLMAGECYQDPGPGNRPTEGQKPAVHLLAAQEAHYKSASYQHQATNCPERWNASFKWTQWTRDSNWWIVIISAVTGVGILWQSNETRKMVAISKRQLIVAHRPKVLVRWVMLKPIGPNGKVKGWSLRLTLVNIGGTTAYLEEWSCRFEWISTQEAAPAFEHIVAGFDLAPGAYREIDIPIPDPLSFGKEMYILEEQARHGNHPVMKFPACSGTICYEDGIGNRRSTGFLRGWNIEEARFLASSDPEREYQD